MTKIITNYRHGDLALLGIEKLPKGLKQAKTKNLMQGSHGNSHSFDNGKLFLKKEDNFIFGYLVAKNTRIYHIEHGNICSVCGYDKLFEVSICPKCKTNFVKENKMRISKIKNGVYGLNRQNEDTNEGMKQVVD